MAEDVILDLDSLERKGKPKPFTTRLGGKTYTFSDPFEMDWRANEAIDPSDNEGSLKALLGDKQWAGFAQNVLPVWKLQALNDAITKHYAKYLGSAGEDSASSGS